MKNVCIVLRNVKNSVFEPNFVSVTDALISGGYFSDEIVLLPYDAVGEFHAKIRSFLNDVDSICIITDKILTDGVKRNLEGTFSLSFSDGFTATAKKTLICVLPAGEEGKNIVSEKIISVLNDRLHNCYARMVVRMVGAPRETVETVLSEAYAVGGDAMGFNFTDNYSDQRLEVIYDSVTPKMAADRVMRIILGELNEYVYDLDDTSLEKRVSEGLRLRKFRLASAESFTGGRISARIVSVSGASEIFDEGLNTYSNEAKMRRLGVKAETLKRYGAVSKQTAHEMAEGLFATGGCDVCVATTGIAGPLSDSTTKPVGLCYIAVGVKGNIFVNEYHFFGDREQITQTAVNQALFSLYKLLK